MFKATGDDPSQVADGSAHSAVVPGATSFQGQLCERGHRPTEQESEQLCGWGALQPRALQVFNTPRWVLFFLSMASFLQGFLINGLVNTVVTSIERRFDLSSSQTGLIVSSFDIASCVCLPFVSYFGNRHKPRWLGWGIGIMGLGSLLFALPHFTTPPYQATVPERSDMCSSNATHFSQHKNSDGLSGYFYVFVLAQLLHGVGSTPLYTLGFTFLDENIKPNNAPVFMGVFYTASAVGPSVGMLLGGFFLRFYSEITLETELTPGSPLWVGAWWIGFLLAGALSLPVAFVILGYPRKLPGSQDTAAPREAEAQRCKDGRLDDFHKPVTSMKTISIPSFLFLSLAVTTVNALIAVISAFFIKFYESQFSVSSSQAALILGAMVIPLCAGSFIGSFVIKRFKLKCRGIIWFCIVISCVGLLLTFMFFIHCPTVSTAGVTVPYSSGQRKIKFCLGHRSFLKDELVAQCNSNCSCERQRFSPVCGADRVMYYSPCFAGCSSINLSSTGEEVFSDCSCVRANVSSAVAGKCVGSCSYKAVFLTLYAISCLCTGLYLIPPITATLRCVPERQKSFALGIQWILVRMLGTIPGPIVLGSLIDGACLLKQSEGQGSCFLYENQQLSHITLITVVVYRVLGAVFFVLALVFLKAEPALDSGDKDTPPPEGAAVKQLQTCL
uniref:Solute carrier organic anion transporter family member n=1 Tax=Neogobius melanostomus TaxID=47308 RepID=A0A8C6U2K4_9GOBI